MSDISIVYTDAFADAYSQVLSQRSRRRIHQALNTIVSFPDTGAAMPRKSLVQRYGADIRTFPAGVYVIVYTHHDSVLTLIALVLGGLIV